MKRALIVVITLLLFISGALSAQNAVDKGKILQTLRPDHPRLLLLKGEEKPFWHKSVSTRSGRRCTS